MIYELHDFTFWSLIRANISNWFLFIPKITIIICLSKKNLPDEVDAPPTDWDDDTVDLRLTPMWSAKNWKYKNNIRITSKQS